MAFNGFTRNEFEIFSLPDFEMRMPAIKERITPRLKELGEALLPALQAATGKEFHAHVAQHLRRRVNPPVETWVAFSPSPRAYKPFTHLRVAINGEGIKFVCHVEEDSDDKPTFAEGLKRNAGTLAGYLARHREIRAGVPRGELGNGSAPPDEAELSALATRLAGVKAQDASFSIALDRADPSLASADALQKEALAALKTLLPLYRLGAEPGVVLDEGKDPLSPC
jgi:uncharacterized protein YktB (UPF0637 family)